MEGSQQRNNPPLSGWVRTRVLLFKILGFTGLGLALFRISLYEQVYPLPLIMLTLGVVLSFFREKGAYIFLLLLPLINSSPALFPGGYPHNYLAPAVFLLGGLFVGKLFSGNRCIEKFWDEGLDWYFFFLLILTVSAFFLFLRWSNLTLPSEAFVADTPVSPSLQRLSFGSIFPVLTLFLFAVSPTAYFLLRETGLSRDRAFTWLSYGFYGSVGLALLQKTLGSPFMFHRINQIKKQFNGGFSDFNALGFFSGFMFLWACDRAPKKHPLGFWTMATALAGIFLSGSRAAFFFLAAGVIDLGIKLKHRHKNKILAAFLVMLLLAIILAGGPFRERLTGSFKPGQDTFQTLNTLSHGRLWMGAFALKTIKDFYLSGIGTGNYLFFLDYRNFGKPHVHDLALNQYLQVFTETGFFGFLLFMFFLLFQWLRTEHRILVGTMLFMLLWNNYLWFPEILALFWVVFALFSQPGKITEIRRHIPFFPLLMLISLTTFMIGNLVGFSSLHPKNWAVEKGIGYDYGFWKPEILASGETYRWTRSRCGLVLSLDRDGKSNPFRIHCGAPLYALPGGLQHVTIYWRGEKLKEIVFRTNRSEIIQVRGRAFQEGFLELRIKPAFLPEQTGTGRDKRSLGVQWFDP